MLAFFTETLKRTPAWSDAARRIDNPLSAVPKGHPPIAIGTTIL